MYQESNITYNWLGEAINNFTPVIKPWLGDLSGEVFGGIAVTILIGIITLIVKIIMFMWTKYHDEWKRANIYFLIPEETPLNQEHLAHQINAFKIFLNEDTNRKLKIKFVMVQNSAEIDEFLNKVKKENMILLTSMSFVFNETLALLLNKNGNTKKINRNIKLIGTLGSESKEHKKAYHPNNIIRIFPPDSDEAKIAYEFFYHKLLSFFCHNSTCSQSSKGKENRAMVTVVHSESYGAALSKKFSDYFYDMDSRSDNEINPFGEQNANDFMTLRMYDFEEQRVILDNNSSFHFIFIVGYEPNIAKMLEMIFKEINDKNIDIEKVCFLFSPTVSVPEWKCNICRTLAHFNNINYKKFFYLKSKLPASGYEFNQNKEKVGSYNVVLDFYNYKLEKSPISKNLKSKVEALNRQPNYINIFAYLALVVAEKVYNKSKKNLHTLKYESFNHVMKNKVSNKPKIYYDGDSYGHFTIRNFECDELEANCERKNKVVEEITKPSVAKKKKRKGKKK